MGPCRTQICQLLAAGSGSSPRNVVKPALVNEKYLNRARVRRIPIPLLTHKPTRSTLEPNPFAIYPAAMTKSTTSAATSAAASAAASTAPRNDKKRRITMMSTGATGPKKAHTAESGQIDVRAGKGKPHEDIADTAEATDNEGLPAPSGGSKVSREASSRSNVSRKTTCRSEEEEEAELERQGLVLVDDGPKSKGKGVEKGKGAEKGKGTEKGKGKGRSTADEVDEDSEEELGAC